MDDGTPRPHGSDGSSPDDAPGAGASSDAPERDADVPDAADLEAARRAIEAADRAVVLTGAGISADSGMPTFRGEDGLWKEHRPEELASPRAFRRDPRLVWEWYAWRREKARSCEPNPGHLALARWTLRDDGVWLATQNVDGLHGETLERARDEAAGSDGVPGRNAAAGAAPGGSAGAAGRAGEADAAGTGRGPPSKRGDDAGRRSPSADERLLELHGSLFRVRCSGCDHRGERREPIDASVRETLPRCPDCGALLRPDVVWFGESLDPDVLEAAFAAGRRADVCLSIGTSAAVEPAASVARSAVQAGAELVEVNPEETALSPLASLTLRGRAAEALPRLLAPKG